MGDVETRDILPEEPGTPETKDEKKERIIKELVEFWNGLSKKDFGGDGTSAAKKLRAQGWIVSAYPGASSYFVKHQDCEQGFLVPRLNYGLKYSAAMTYRIYRQDTGALMPYLDSDLISPEQSWEVLGGKKPNWAIRRLRKPAIVNPYPSKYLSKDCESEEGWSQDYAEFAISKVIPPSVFGEKTLDEFGAIEVGK